MKLFKVEYNEPYRIWNCSSPICPFSFYLLIGRFYPEFFLSFSFSIFYLWLLFLFSGIFFSVYLVYGSVGQAIFTCKFVLDISNRFLQIAAKIQQPLIRSVFIALFSACRAWRIANIFFNPKHFPHFGTYFRSPPNPRICALCIINQIHAPGPKVGIQLLNFSPIFRHNWFNLSASFFKNCLKALPR